MYEPGGTGGTCPPSICNKQEGPFLFSKIALFPLRKKVPLKCRAPKFAMLPISLISPRIWSIIGGVVEDHQS